MGKGLSGTIKICQQLGLSKEQTLEHILECIAIDPELTLKYLDRYWTTN